jgi:hypothetical protein
VLELLNCIVDNRIPVERSQNLTYCKWVVQVKCELGASGIIPKVTRIADEAILHKALSPLVGRINRYRYLFRANLTSLNLISSNCSIQP